MLAHFVSFEEMAPHLIPVVVVIRPRALCIGAGSMWVSDCRARWFPTGTGVQSSMSICLEHLFMPLPVADSKQYLADKFQIV